MTWTKLPDSFGDAPEVLALSDAAFRLHILALVWCNKHLQDGAVPRHALGHLTTVGEPETLVKELVSAGLWSEVATGWLIAWEDQEKAVKVRARQKDAKERKELWQERGERHRKGDHSICTKNCPHARNTVPSTVPSTVRNGTPSRPDPTPREGRKGTGRDSAP